jgi:hypothetical protein
LIFGKRLNNLAHDCFFQNVFLFATGLNLFFEKCGGEFRDRRAFKGVFRKGYSDIKDISARQGFSRASWSVFISRGPMAFSAVPFAKQVAR